MEKYCCHIDVDGEGIGAAKDCKENPSTSCVIRPEAVLERTKQKATQAIWLSLSLLTACSYYKIPVLAGPAEAAAGPQCPVSVWASLILTPLLRDHQSQLNLWCIFLNVITSQFLNFTWTPKHDVCFRSKSQTSHVQRSSD